MRIYLVRHGQSEWNAESRVQGQEPIGLSPLGREQAQRTGVRLARRSIGAIWSSDLPRAYDTALAIAEPLGLPITLRADLRERHFGEFQGLVFGEIQRRFPDIWDPVFRGEGRPPGGESRADVTNRVGTLLEELLAQPPAEEVVLVAHGGPIRALLGHLLGVAPHRAWQFRVDNCAVHIVDTYPEGAILGLLNDSSHLTDDPW